MTIETLERALRETQRDLAAVKETLGTLIAWMAQSANSPLSVANLQRLIDMLPASAMREK